MNFYTVTASFLGTAVEFVEALTIFLAVGFTKGWKTAIYGAVTAIVILALLVGLLGYPLVKLVPFHTIQLVIGLALLLFGVRWLRKAIARYAGLKEMHDEEKAYLEEVEKQKTHVEKGKSIDIFGFTTVFNGVFLEGLEAAFIVLTFGVAANSMPSAVAGALIAIALVCLLGFLLKKPLSMIPENMLKFAVGIMLTCFGVIWVGEAIGIEWWQGDLSILVVLAVLLIFSLFHIKYFSLCATVKGRDQ